MAEQLSFRKEERLRKRREFVQVYEQGEKIRGSSFFIYILENNRPYSRLGITASRRIGPPVVRNRIKRRLREIFRMNKGCIVPPADVVVNTRRSAGAASYVELEQDFLRTLKQRRASVQ